LTFFVSIGDKLFTDHDLAALVGKDKHCLKKRLPSFQVRSSVLVGEYRLLVGYSARSLFVDLAFKTGVPKLTVCSYKPFSSSYDPYSVEKLLVSEGLVYGCCAGDLFRLPAGRPQCKHPADLVVVYKNNQRSIVDFCMSSLSLFILLSADQQLKVVDIVTQQVFIKVGEFNGLRILVPSSFDIMELPVVVSVTQDRGLLCTDFREGLLKINHLTSQKSLELRSRPDEYLEDGVHVVGFLDDRNLLVLRDGLP